MSRFVSVLLVLFLLGCVLTACASPRKAGEPSPSSLEGEKVGAFEINGALKAVELPERAQSAFDKAAADYSESVLTPVALLGTQIVAGTNYSVLCLSAPENRPSSLAVATIYEDLSGNASVQGLVPFLLEEYAAVEENAGGTEALLPGGWAVNQDFAEASLPSNVQKTFDLALEGFTGSGFVPVALLGSQIVAGTNHAVLCLRTPVTADPAPQICVLTVTEGLDGSGTILSICDVDITAFAVYSGMEE